MLTSRRCALDIGISVEGGGSCLPLRPTHPRCSYVQTSHPLALRYNDRSPLEHMHAATTFIAMRQPGFDVLSCAIESPEERATLRETMIEMFLATDNALVSGLVL